jgi:hypothetical protein
MVRRIVFGLVTAKSNGGRLNTGIAKLRFRAATVLAQVEKGIQNGLREKRTRSIAIAVRFTALATRHFRIPN